jgi:PAS domain-containing protein
MTMEIDPQPTFAPVRSAPRELSTTIRRWTRDLARLRARAVQLKRPAEMPGSPVHEALEEAVSTSTALLQELAGAELEIQRRSADTAVERQQADYLFDRMPTACVCADEEGRITRANRAAALLLNVSVRHLVGQPLLLFTVDREAFLDLTRSMRRDRAPIQCALVIRPRERSAIPVSVALLPRGPGNTTEWLWFLAPAPVGPAVAS